MTEKLKLQDLEFVESTAIAAFKDGGKYRLEGMTRTVNTREQTLLAHLTGSFALLVKLGILTVDQLPVIPKISDDSEPPETDYEY